MKNTDINLMQLEATASALGDLLPHVTFVGGSTTALLVDESARFGVRQTDDVDVIIDVATLVEYNKFAKRLREHRFREDTEGPICRWLFETDVGNLKLDVMPISEKILGFSNRWYKAAIQEPNEITLPNGIAIQVVSPAYFLATKFEAFRGRGKGDFFSHDLEDIVFVLENRHSLVNELMDCDRELKHYLAVQAAQLLNDEFLNVLPGLLNNPASARIIENTLNIIKSWK